LQSDHSIILIYQNNTIYHIICTIVDQSNQTIDRFIHPSCMYPSINQSINQHIYIVPYIRNEKCRVQFNSYEQMTSKMYIISRRWHYIHTAIAYVHQSFLGQLRHNERNGSLHAGHVTHRRARARLTQSTHQRLFTGAGGGGSHRLRDTGEALTRVKLMRVGG